MAELIVLIVKTGFALVLIALAARFMAQVAQVDPYGPMAETVRKISNPFVSPFMLVIPRIRGLDLPALLVIWLLQVVMAFILVSMLPQLNAAVSTIIVGGAFATAGLILEVTRWSMIIVAIGSWLSSGAPNPLLAFLRDMIEPVVAPFRKLNLQVGMLDLSYLLAFLVLYIVHGILRAIAYSIVPMGQVRVAFLGI
ncbi:YggT family protein [Natronospirillum operosum]|uniref:YggT family protein n=1 Tax=Natronospirillum operosum TaxID=2759953 RepID=A0A4Z0WA22_9GAMM|nr:YggT family protein [Natronospirillum operosum]TGG90069.1 YggT family protein [Natronospirillum operosum]